MANNKKPQQSATLKKVLIIGLPILAIIALLPQGDPVKSTGKSKAAQLLAAAKSKKSVKDVLYTPEDSKAKFDPINTSLKNSFIPLVTKRDRNGPVARNGVPSDFAGGEATWIYTGNMTVDGTPNALFENTATGDGIFLRPGQHWKSMQLVTVREDSVEVEGPGGAMKTIYFDDGTEITANVDSNALSPLPPATPESIPNTNGTGRRRNRNNNGGNNQFADNGGLNGPIGQANQSGDPSFQPQDQQFSSGQFSTRRSNRNRRNNENNFN